MVDPFFDHIHVDLDRLSVLYSISVQIELRRSPSMSDLLIVNGLIVTLDKQRRIIEDGAVAVEGNKIVAIGKTDDIAREYHGEKVIDADGMAVLPGLVDCHVHLAQALIRGCADDVPLIPWLRDYVWVLQGNFTPEDGRASAELAMAEFIRSGTTTFVECMIHRRYGFNGIAEAVDRAGMRAVLSKIVMDMPGYALEEGIMYKGMIEEKEETTRETLDMLRKWHGHDGRIQVWFGPRTPGACTPELYREIVELARQHRTGITMHLAEVKDDVDYTRREFGKLPAEFARDLGLIGRNVLLAHMVWLTQPEIEILGRSNTNTVHCPSSNMKLGSGIAKIPEMIKAGVNVSLGCDGGPSNNTYDMLREMKIAALLQKVRMHDPTRLQAETVLEMATINGAKAVGLEHEIGSLEESKKADIILLELRKPHLIPIFSIVSNLVYAANGSDVDTTIVDGRILMEKKKLLTIDEDRVLREAERRARSLLGRSGIKLRPNWGTT